MSAPVAPTQTMTPDQRRRLRGAVTGGAFGFFVDMYDVYLPTIALAPAIAYFIPTTLPASTQAVIAALVFVATLFGRPVGSIILGPFADRIGRKKITLFSIAGCGAATLVIAFLPGYAQVGGWAIAAIILLRFIDGIFIGGEYTGAMALAMEASPRYRRGFFGALVACGFPLSYCVIALITFWTLRIAPAGDVSSAYSQWGWRIPFVIGAVFSAVFLWYYSRHAQEAPDVHRTLTTERFKHPVGRILGAVPRNYWGLFVLMLGVWFGSNMASSLLPATAGSGSDQSASSVTLIIVIAQAIHTALFPVIGLLADRFGRRSVLLACGILTGSACAVMFAVFGAGGVSGFWTVFLLVVLIRITGASVFALMPSYLCERFPTALRGTGYGLSYSLPLVVTGFYAYYQDWLTAVMPLSMTPVVILVVAGVLMVVGTLLGPETKRYDLDDHPLAAAYRREPAVAAER